MYQHQHLFAAEKSALQTLINVNLTNLSLYTWFMVTLPHRGEARCQTLHRWMWITLFQPEHSQGAWVQSSAQLLPQLHQPRVPHPCRTSRVPNTASTEPEHLFAEQCKTPAMTHPSTASARTCSSCYPKTSICSLSIFHCQYTTDL